MVKRISINAREFINADRLCNTFIELVKLDTGSDPVHAETRIPSTPAQFEMAELLSLKLTGLGLKNVSIDNHAIVTGTLPGNLLVKPGPVIGLLAHMDTSKAVPTGPVQPQIQTYAGGDIVLKNDVKIVEDELKNHIGHTLITSDGTTLLGADDKAGIAEILEALQVLAAHPEIPRPDLKIAFTPDEETGLGVRKFNCAGFGADAAYTIDGSEPNEIETGSFNAFGTIITCKGRNVHPGYAYNVMINSLLMANDIVAGLDRTAMPHTTRNDQGYIHVQSINGEEEQTTLKFIIRDFNYEEARKKVAFLENLAHRVKDQYPGSDVRIETREQYRNMKTELDAFPEVSAYAKAAIQAAGLTPAERSIRGGTDGSQLSLAGLPTPNLGAGGHNFHAKNEFVSIDDMVTCTAVILQLMQVWADNADAVMPKILERRRSTS